MILDVIIRNRFGRKLLICACNIASVCNRILPKNKNWIFFCESVNCEFHDNSRYLYDYMKSHYKNPHLKYFICASNISKNKKFTSKNTFVVNRILGAVLFLLCKYCFYSYSFFKITPSKNQIVVNQWHGSPLKAIGAMSKDDIYINEKNNYFTYILSAAPIFSPVFVKAFKCKPEQVLLCGHTRTDSFAQTVDVYKALKLKKYSKLIVWMPTFRTTIDGRHNDLGKDFDYKQNETLLPLLTKFSELEKINAFLREKNCLLIIKFHSIAIANEKEYSNIKMFKDSDLNENGLDTYHLLRSSDALLTDYSSVFFDYLLLNRPIGFIIDDIELYKKNRGFGFDDPLNMMPGFHIREKKELISFMRDVCNGHDKFKEERVAKNIVFNQTQDFQNCKRLLSLIDFRSW